jgi:hypothetical protein
MSHEFVREETRVVCSGCGYEPEIVTNGKGERFVHFPVESTICRDKVRGA